MNKKVLSSALCVLVSIVFFISSAFSAPSIAPFVPDSSKPETTPERFTSPRSVYPTNKWYSSVYSHHPSKGAHKYSYKMSPRPLSINFNSREMSTDYPEGKGYMVGLENVPTVTNSLIMNLGGQETGWITKYDFKVSAKKADNTEISSNKTQIESFSDWALTAVCQDSISPNSQMKVTFGKGFIFTYNYYSSDLKPYFATSDGSIIRVFDANSSIPKSSGTNFTGDRAMIKVKRDNKTKYYGIYGPNADMSLSISASSLDINFSAATPSSERYISFALLYTSSIDNASEDAVAHNIFNDYYKYAYNFITDTKTSYSFNRANAKLKTDFNFTFSSKRSGTPFLNGTVCALFPHQWRNMSASFETQTYKGLRGELKLLKGVSSFSTEYDFNGIIPYLTYQVPEKYKNKLQSYINAERNADASIYNPNTYDSGKAVARIANMIPVLHQIGDFQQRDTMIGRLKSELSTWFSYTGQTSKYFARDNIWGGIIGIPTAHGSRNYNDHNFHYGYFVYASAILAMYDPSFAAEYGGIVEILIKDYANTDRASTQYPYLRAFDVYEGHSWANGFGGLNNDGVDQESSSEAMNAWAGIYLWGLATNNQNLMDLGIYGYTTEYAAIREYYLDITGETYQEYRQRGYDHNSVGILWDNRIDYRVLWNMNTASPQEIKGIQILPLTPSMLYLGYDTAYAEAFYDEMISEPNQKPNLWKDIWARFVSMYNPELALNIFSTVNTAEPGSSLTYSYHFIHFFNALGTVDTGYYADSPAFCIMKKAGKNTFIAYNNTDAIKNINFYKRGGNLVGTITVPAYTMVSTKDFIEIEYYSNGGYIAQYKGNGWSVLISGQESDFTDNPNLNIIPKDLPPEDERYDYLGPSFEIIKESSVNFNNKVPLTFNFTGISVPANMKEDNIRLAYIDPQGKLEINSDLDIAPISKSFNLNIDQAGTYVLVFKRDTPKKLKTYTFPNPYKASKHASKGITFANIKQGDNIKIFNIAGEMVYEKKMSASGDYKWDVRNNSGNFIASGIYIYIIESQGSIYKGKIAVER